MHETSAAIVLSGALGLIVGRALLGYADWFRRSLIHPSGPPEQPVPAQRTAVKRFRDWVPLVGSMLRSPQQGRLSAGPALTIELGTGCAFALYVAAMLVWQCQQVEMVVPSETWRHGRIAYHLALIALLIAAAATDFIDYVIPDEIVATGTLVGVAGAVVSGDLQMVHLWFDWNQANMVIDGQMRYGAYIPEWIREHPHWHGVAWSLAGLAAGAGMIWMLRIISSLLLGQEAIGLGDVTLMAMVGSFIGWQPVCFVVMLAPACGILAGFGVKLLTGRTFIAFGPYLCAATYLVLCTWRWLWEPTRDIFGHVPSLALLGGIALGGLILLLVLLRIYRALPVKRRET